MAKKQVNSVKIGIIGAMDSEVSLLREAMNITRETVKAGMIFTEGKLGGNEAVIAKCGMGKVNAGVCTQILIDTFGAPHIINTGVAGALNDSLNIGDIVVSVDAVQDDFDVTHIGFRAGEIPYTGKIAFEGGSCRGCSRCRTGGESHRGADMFRGSVPLKAGNF